MSVERGGVSVAARSTGRVEGLRVSIAAPARGIRAFAPRESIGTDRRVAGFSPERFKAFTPELPQSLRRAETPKVSLIKASPQFDGFTPTFGLEMKPTQNVPFSAPKLSPVARERISLMKKTREDDKSVLPKALTSPIIRKEAFRPLAPTESLPLIKPDFLPSIQRLTLVDQDKRFQLVKAKQRVSDLRQADRVIKAWENFAGPQKKEEIKAKVMAIVQQNQDAPKAHLTTQKVNLTKNKERLTKFINPRLEKDEFEKIVRQMTRKGLKLAEINQQLQESHVLVNHETPSLGMIFKIVLAEVSVQQKSEQKTSLPIPEKQKAVASVLLRREEKVKAKTVEEKMTREVNEKEENGVICFAKDLSVITMKDVTRNEIKDETAIGIYTTLPTTSEKGDAQGLVNKKKDPHDHKLIETDGKIGIGEICPDCLGMLKDRNLKMTVKKGVERSSRKQTKEVVIYNFKDNGLRVAA